MTKDCDRRYLNRQGSDTLPVQIRDWLLHYERMHLMLPGVIWYSSEKWRRQTREAFKIFKRRHADKAKKEENQNVNKKQRKGEDDGEGNERDEDDVEGNERDEDDGESNEVSEDDCEGDDVGEDDGEGDIKLRNRR
jgi:hypothetical protein